MSQPIKDTDSFAWTTPPFCKSGPTLNVKLQAFEQSNLSCHICREFFRNAVSLSVCNHSFCSECIRVSLSHGKRSINRTRNCPICRAEVKEDDSHAIVPNWALQETVDKYQEMRPLLYNSLVRLQSVDEGKETVGELKKSSSFIKSNNDSVAKNIVVGGESNGVKTTTFRRSKRRKLVDITLSDFKSSDRDSTDDNDLDEEYIEEGSALTSQRYKNMEITSTPLQVPQQKVQRKHFFYHGVKKAKLQELCKNEGLATTGSDSQLKERHVEFVRIWNAECDAKNPRSKNELVKEATQRESARKSELKQAMLSGVQCHTTYMERIKDSRKLAGKNSNLTAIISSGNAAFDSSMESKFKDLIHKVKKNMTAKCTRKDSFNCNRRTSLSAVTQASNATLSAIPDKHTAVKSSHSKVPGQSSSSTQTSSTDSSIQPSPLAGSPTPATLIVNSSFCQGGKNIDTPVFSSRTSSFPTRHKKRLANTPRTEKWTCDQCTYENEHFLWSNTKAKCKMCQKDRPLTVDGTSDRVIEIIDC